MIKPKLWCDKHSQERIHNGKKNYKCSSCVREWSNAWASKDCAARPEFYTMKNAMQRCNNSKNHHYHNYGGRGIEFRFESAKSAEQWVLEHLGPRPSGHSLDRVDNNGHYEPGNLRWSSSREQASNKRGHCPTCKCKDGDLN